MIHKSTRPHGWLGGWVGETYLGIIKPVNNEIFGSWLGQLFCFVLKKPTQEVTLFSCLHRIYYVFVHEQRNNRANKDTFMDRQMAQMAVSALN